MLTVWSSACKVKCILCSSWPASTPPSPKEPHWWKLQLLSVTSTTKFDGQVFLMETITLSDFHSSIFDPLLCTGTRWIVDKVMIENSLNSVLICDIHTARFPLDCNRAAVCPCTLFRLHFCRHSEGCALYHIFKKITFEQGSQCLITFFDGFR